jgi:cytochrome c-type biogenesis protein CcmH
LILVVLLLALFLLLLSLALNAESIASDPLVEARLKSLSQELRCLVCQNQTLADSTAPLAEDLRREIRELIAKGMTDEEITNYLVARYGDFVRYRPPFKSQTALLWLGPTVMLIIGFVVLWVTLRRRNKTLPNDYEVADEI